MRGGSLAQIASCAARNHDVTPQNPAFSLVALKAAAEQGDRAGAERWAAITRAAVRAHLYHLFALEEAAALPR